MSGSVSVLLDAVPQQSAVELRTRVFAERDQELSDRIRLRLSGYVDSLLADRDRRSVGDAIVRPQDVYVELHAERYDLRFGASRLVWGRLDEFQPTDVINPLDLTRFLLHGRGEARLPVVMVRNRLFLSRATVVEAVVVPFFRRGVYDQLDAPTAPFNLDPPVQRLVPIVERAPARTWRNVQGGARVTTTIGRVDLGAAVYRGVRAFPVAGFRSADGADGFAAPAIVKTFPRYALVGVDFETVRGEWGIRGEAAGFIGDDGFDGGAGIDRRAGSYRLAGNVLWSRRGDDDDVSLVAAADRSFARETRTVRVFAVYNPAQATMFARVAASVSLRDNLSFEGSGGVFAGAPDAAGGTPGGLGSQGEGGSRTIGQLGDRDFAYVGVKIFF